MIQLSAKSLTWLSFAFALAVSRWLTALGDAISCRVRERRNYALMGELWDPLVIPSPPLGDPLGKRVRVRGN